MRESTLDAAENNSSPATSDVPGPPSFAGKSREDELLGTPLASTRPILETPLKHHEVGD